MKIKFQKVVGNLLDKLRKLIAHECKVHLAIFSSSQAKENSRPQYLLLRTDISQKTVDGCPWYLLSI